MLEQHLRAIIPSQVEEFPKLTEGRDPYYFYRWDFDNDKGSSVLRYYFWSPDRTRQYRKRVFISEAERLLRCTLNAGEMTRQDFQEHCPNTRRDGGCGFAVIIAILESLGIVEHADHWGVYRIVDRDRAQRLLQR